MSEVPRYIEHAHIFNQAPIEGGRARKRDSPRLLRSPEYRGTSLIRNLHPPLDPPRTPLGP